MEVDTNANEDKGEVTVTETMSCQKRKCAPISASNKRLKCSGANAFVAKEDGIVVWVETRMSQLRKSFPTLRETLMDCDSLKSIQLPTPELTEYNYNILHSALVATQLAEVAKRLTDIYEVRKLQIQKLNQYLEW
jgi:hypothetical protein